MDRIEFYIPSKLKKMVKELSDKEEIPMSVLFREGINEIIRKYRNEDTKFKKLLLSAKKMYIADKTVLI